MRINELLESLNFKETEYLSDSGDLDFDLTEDLSFFMNNDDDTYRRHVYPAIVKCLSKLERKEPTSPAIFKVAATESYKNYIQKYPIRQLPESLEIDSLKEVCKKFYEEICKQVEEGKYKD